MFEALKNDAAGLAILREWLGHDGIPVPDERAQSRAAICLGCPENREPRWWELAKGGVARAIKKHLEVKYSLGLQVEGEGSLGICRVCRCCLPLKVHVPIQHVSNHIADDMWETFPAFCWVRVEGHK